VFKLIFINRFEGVAIYLSDAGLAVAGGHLPALSASGWYRLLLLGLGGLIYSLG
jgi:hypothetical protein